MKKIFLFILFGCIFALQSISQSGKDSIEIHKDFLSGLKFYQNDKRVPLGQLTNVMRSNADALKYLNKARTHNTIAIITGVIGGLLIGYELGRLVRGEDINWGVMGTGIGIGVISIPFDIGFKRNARKAVYLFNAAYR